MRFCEFRLLLGIGLLVAWSAIPSSLARAQDVEVQTQEDSADSKEEVKGYGFQVEKKCGLYRSQISGPHGNLLEFCHRLIPGIRDNAAG